jgi:hypothetical protein
MDNEYGVFLGLGVGKGGHHAIGLDPAGKQPHHAALPNSEPELREVFGKLAKHGRILVVNEPKGLRNRARRRRLRSPQADPRSRAL